MKELRAVHTASSLRYQALDGAGFYAPLRRLFSRPRAGSRSSLPPDTVLRSPRLGAINTDAHRASVHCCALAPEKVSSLLKACLPPATVLSGLTLDSDRRLMRLAPRWQAPRRTTTILFSGSSFSRAPPAPVSVCARMQNKALHTAKAGHIN